jgi:Cytochrome P460
VLVKEVFQTATGTMKTGIVSRAQTLKGWFVMVKDSKDSHSGNALWGDGWAWSWFDADNPSKTTSTNYRVNCLPCHVPARAADLIYVQGYPPLEQAH